MANCAEYFGSGRHNGARLLRLTLGDVEYLPGIHVTQVAGGFVCSRSQN